MAQAQFPEPNDLELSADKVVGDGKPVEFGKHTVSNPHPGFGKDPNIGNEFGHTHYPKWVKDVQGKDIIVNNPKEEAELTAPKEETALKQDGPTIEAWVAAGYKASKYPPAGYVSKSSKEEIDAAIAAEKPAKKSGW